MNTRKNREKIIKEFLGLEEMTPMEAGEIRGGKENGKQIIKIPSPNEIDVEIDG